MSMHNTWNTAETQVGQRLMLLWFDFKSAWIPSSVTMLTLHALMHAHTHAPTHAFLHACMHTCMHTHTHTHTHICHQIWILIFEPYIYLLELILDTRIKFEKGFYQAFSLFCINEDLRIFWFIIFTTFLIMFKLLWVVTNDHRADSTLTKDTACQSWLTASTPFAWTWIVCTAWTPQ